MAGCIFIKCIIYKLPLLDDKGNGHDTHDELPQGNDRSHEMIEQIDQSLRNQDTNVENSHPTVIEHTIDNNNNKDAGRDEEQHLVKDSEGEEEMKLGPPLVSHHNEKQEEIINAFKHAWKEYKASAWGMDEVKPVSHSPNTWFNLGLTIIDSLDTIWIMGLQEEYNEARQWVEHGLNIAQNRDVNLFEVTIRVLGGLLSAYHLTNDILYLDKAVSYYINLLIFFFKMCIS